VRVLSLGFPLPDPQVDNYDWAHAPSFFDYDAIVVDPAVAVSDLIEGVARDGLSFTSYNEEPVENGPTTATTVGLADLLRRRADEAERVLAKGGLVVVFAYPDVPHPRVSGFTGAHRYHWLPAPAGTGYGRPYLQTAEGISVVATDYEHPFADFFERHRGLVSYRAIMGEGAEGFGEAAKIIARSPGGAVLGVDLAVGGGHVVLLPALYGRMTSSDRSAVATTLVSAIRNHLLIAAEGPAPAWVSGFDLPGLHEAQERTDRAEEKLERLEDEADDARKDYRVLDRYRRLLWQEGKYGLDLPVRDALSFLGMTSFSRPDDPAVLNYESQYVLLECEGSAGAVGMTPHFRLRARMEREIEETSRSPMGLIVVNGFRDLAPPTRPQQYIDALRVAAETMSYCVVEASRIFEAVQARMSGNDDGVKTFLRGLMETKGVYAGTSVEVFEFKKAEPPEEEAGPDDEQEEEADGE
jgi:hypothetical protein